MEAIKQMLTQPQIEQQLHLVGWHDGMTVLVHSSLSKIQDWIPGGTQAIIGAMLSVLGQDGTLIMPTFTADNSEPSYWQNPPIPEAWWQTVREVMPAFDPHRTPSGHMGALAESFRIWQGARRSTHPQGSFTALGKHARDLIENHTLEHQFGENSPLGRIYANDGYVFLLGVGHGNNTSLHLAEERITTPVRSPQASAMTVNGERQWVTFETVDYNSDDFERLGADYEHAHPTAVQVGKLGNATTRLMRQRPLVDFAVAWLNQNR